MYVHRSVCCVRALTCARFLLRGYQASELVTYAEEGSGHPSGVIGASCSECTIRSQRSSRVPCVVVHLSPSGEIYRDIPRTFPLHPLFAENGEYRRGLPARAQA